METELEQIIQALLPFLRKCTSGEYGIALGGAHAKGIEDEESDIDLYVFARKILPNTGRANLLDHLADRDKTISSWGETAEFAQAGTDFYFQGKRIECWFRNMDYINGIIDECKAGVIKRDFITWTVMGFYNHCTLSDLSKMVPVEDPYHVLAQWKDEVNHYPRNLRTNIIRDHLGAARFWPENFHYISAIERGDIIYTSGIVQQVIHNLIQVIFAVNQAYFSGDKKIDTALESLKLKPARCAERVKSLLFPAHPADRAFLEAQRQELHGLLYEVEKLVAQTVD